jgi:hypothetical protein
LTGFSIALALPAARVDLRADAAIPMRAGGAAALAAGRGVERVADEPLSISSDRATNSTRACRASSWITIGTGGASTATVLAATGAAGTGMGVTDGFGMAGVRGALGARAATTAREGADRETGSHG